MYNLFGSKSKEIIFQYLSKNTNKTLKEITNDTKIAYKYVYKIVNEFTDKKIVEKNGKRYSLTSEFVEYYRKIGDLMTESYISNIYLKNRLDLYNAFCSLEEDEKVKAKVNGLIDSWFFEKIDDWYSKAYDPEKIEHNKAINSIQNKFGKNKKIKILEVGCGTGRSTFEIIDTYPNVTSIDISDKYIDYCEKKAKKLKKKVNFYCSDIVDFSSKEKFEVIIFNWMGFHYQSDCDKIIENVKKIISDKGLILILDAYYDTEYIKILQMLRETDLKYIKLKNEELNEKLIKEFGNFKQEVVLTNYKFDSIKDVIDTFKIELTLEESHIWTKKDEETLRKQIEKKKDPLVVQEGLWFSTIEV